MLNVSIEMLCVHMSTQNWFNTIWIHRDMFCNRIFSETIENWRIYHVLLLSRFHRDL